MKDNIAGIVEYGLEYGLDKEEMVKQILALFKESELKWYNAGWDDCMKSALDIRGFPSLEGIVVEDKCLNDEGVITPWISSTPEGCPLCHGTGIITRPAEWGILK